MRVWKFVSRLSAVALLLAPELAYMEVMGGGPTASAQTCFLSFVPCNTGGYVGLSNYMASTLFWGAQSIFMAAAMLMFMYYGLRLVLQGKEESTISEVKEAYGYGIAGAAIVSVASVIVQTVGQNSVTTGNLIDQSALWYGLGNLQAYFRILVATVVGVTVVYHGMRLVVLQGDEGEMDATKKKFFHSLLGVAAVLLANAVVSAFVLPLGGGTGSAGVLITEIVGISNFLLVILGGLSVVSFMVAGLFLVISVDEGLKDRAKQAILGTVVAMIIVLSSYAIVNFVIALV